MSSEAAKNRAAWLTGPLKADELQLVRAEITEELSQVAYGRIEFASDNSKTDVTKLIGQSLSLETEFEYLDNNQVSDKKRRKWSFLCVSVEYLGEAQGLELYAAEVRSWLWYLTQGVSCRIFQKMSAPEIIREIAKDHGRSNDLKLKLNGTYEKREYCVQYNETNYDFIYRLMAEEGIFFSTEDKDDFGLVVLMDGADYVKIEDTEPVGFQLMDGDRVPGRCAFELQEKLAFVPHKFELRDYDPSKATADQIVKLDVGPDKNLKNALEQYRYPARSYTKKVSNDFVKYRREQTQLAHHTFKGQSTMLPFVAGRTFKMKDHPNKDYDVEYALTRVHHRIEVQSERFYRAPDPHGPLRPELDFRDGNTIGYANHFEAIPKGVSFRTGYTVPWPQISGVQTALVTGKKGEELEVSKDGKITVQFYWDRDGKGDEKTSAQIRVAMPWTGDGYGMAFWPRIGQEVIVQFEDGNPDRPLCTGMLYNSNRAVASGLPASASQTSIITRSTKKGTDKTFHELTFEDKEKAEKITFQSERDYKQVIKNNAEITIGLEHKDKGDLSQTIHRHKTETLKTGDHTFKVAQGSQRLFTKQNVDNTVEGKVEETITGDYATTVKAGNVKQTVKLGNVTRRTRTGNVNEMLDVGNYTLKAQAGQVTIEAMQKITLKVGMSKIELSPFGIKINGMMVEAKGVATAKVAAPMTTVSGAAMLKLGGGLVKIN